MGPVDALGMRWTAERKVRPYRMASRMVRVGGDRLVSWRGKESTFHKAVSHRSIVLSVPTLPPLPTEPSTYSEFPIPTLPPSDLIPLTDPGPGPPASYCDGFGFEMELNYFLYLSIYF